MQDRLLQREHLSQRSLPRDQIMRDQFCPRIGDRLFRQPQTHGDRGVAVERESLLITDRSEKEISTGL